MKNLLLILLPLLLFYPTLDGQTLRDSLQQQMQAQLDASVASEQFVGGAVGISIPGQAPLFSTAGWANAKTAQPFQLTTYTRIASIAKSMTAVAALQLHERGLLVLDAPIQTYLPSFSQGDKITTRQLLYHTAGISAYQGKESENRTFYPNLAAAVEVFQNRPLVHEPGTAFAYTTYGYTLLGRIIEVVAGQDYESYMQEHVWNPAGMQHTGVEKPGLELDPKSELYVITSKGKLKLRKANDLSNRIPGGGLYSTVEDLLRFGEAVVTHQLLADTTTALMFTLPTVEKEGNPYAMGWHFYGPAGQESVVVGHAGEQTGCAAQLMINRHSGLVVVVLTNTGRAWREVIGITAALFPVANRLSQIDQE